MLSKITPMLWFDTEALDAAKFYTGIFKNSKMGDVLKFPATGQEVHGKDAGSVMTVEFELEGQHFTALNGGPQFKFTEAVSFVVECADQAEVDYYWEKLGADGDPEAQQCGWLKDKFGLSWQIVPTSFLNMLRDPDEPRRKRCFAAMMEMQKLDIAALERAARG